MKTKKLTDAERLLAIFIHSEMRMLKFNNSKLTITQGVQLISIPEFETLPKIIKIDKEDCWNYIKKQCGLRSVGSIEEIPEEVKTNTLYIGLHYQEADRRYAVCFKNERFWTRRSGLIIADLTRMYLIEKILKENSYKTATMQLSKHIVRSTTDSIIRDMGVRQKKDGVF